MSLSWLVSFVICIREIGTANICRIPFCSIRQCPILAHRFSLFQTTLNIPICHFFKKCSCHVTWGEEKESAAYRIPILQFPQFSNWFFFVLHCFLSCFPWGFFCFVYLLLPLVFGFILFVCWFLFSFQCVWGVLFVCCFCLVFSLLLFFFLCVCVCLYPS